MIICEGRAAVGWSQIWYKFSTLSIPTGFLWRKEDIASRFLKSGVIWTEGTKGVVIDINGHSEVEETYCIVTHKTHVSVW